MKTLRFQSLTHTGPDGKPSGKLAFQEKDGEPFLWVGVTGHGARWAARALVEALSAGPRTAETANEAVQAGIRAYREAFATHQQRPCPYPDGDIFEGFGVLALNRRGEGQALSRGRFRFCQVRGRTLQPLPESAGFEAFDLRAGDYLIANPENAEIVLPIRDALGEEPPSALPEILRAQSLPFALVFAVGETPEPVRLPGTEPPVFIEKNNAAPRPGASRALTGAVLLLALLVLGGWLVWQKPWQTIGREVAGVDSTAALPVDGAGAVVDSADFSEYETDANAEPPTQPAPHPDLAVADSLFRVYQEAPGLREALLNDILRHLAQVHGVEKEALDERERTVRQELESRTEVALREADRQYHLAEAYIQDGKNEKAGQALDAARQGYQRYLNLKPDREAEMQPRFDKVERLTALVTGEGEF